MPRTETKAKPTGQVVLRTTIKREPGKFYYLSSTGLLSWSANKGATGGSLPTKKVVREDGYWYYVGGGSPLTVMRKTRAEIAKKAAATRAANKKKKAARSD